MKVFVCRICGDPYLGEESPDACPFCGAERKFLVLASVWKEENNIELSEVSRKNLITALELEVGAAKFYGCVEKAVSNVEISKTFKNLRKVETEHAAVFKKLLKIDTDPETSETCADDIIGSLQESNRREHRAVELYHQFANEAVEPRVKEVFEAIAKVEENHITLDNQLIEKYQS